MLTIYFQRDSKIPIYKQLYDFIKQSIEDGQLAPDEKLPSKRKLALHLKISPLTIDTAYQQLVLEGYVRVVPQSGFYVEQIFAPKKQIEPARKTTVPSTKVTYRYDFKTNVVDTSLFPNTLWAKLVREGLNNLSFGLLNEVEAFGLSALREDIAKYLFHYRGMQVTKEQIIIGAGSESIFSLLIQLLGRKAIYGVENPGYPKFVRLLQNNGCQTVPIDIDDNGLSVASLKQSKAQIVHTTPSHQFPMGVVMPLKRRHDLLHWALAEKDRYIVEDDYDSEFRFVGKPIPALQSLDFSGKVIYLNSFTKSLAPSLRIHYMVIPSQLLQMSQSLFAYYTCSVPNLEQYTLYQFMAGGFFERHLNRMRNAYKMKLIALKEAIAHSSLKEAIHIIGDEAGLHFLMQVNLDRSEEELIHRAKVKGVRLYGLSEYDLWGKTPSTPATMVVGYSALNEKEIREAIALLELAWKTF